MSVVEPDVSLDPLRQLVKKPALGVYERAVSISSDIQSRAGSVLNDYLAANGIDSASVSFVCVGSVGRSEALESSDLDIVPVLSTPDALLQFAPHDAPIRKRLADEIGISVSKGEDLTKAVCLNDLTAPDQIGGAADNSNTLTKRILITTEGRQLAGRLSLADVRREVLSAYGREERTSGRHVLSFCNDIARYFRTLCIEYKAKVDAHGKDWCTRNLKLRHSRKIWYFSTLISVATLSERHPRGESEYFDALLLLLQKPPVWRLIDALNSSQNIELGRLLEQYSYFLEFMSKKSNREALALVDHDSRHDLSKENPFPAMKLNSDVIHSALVAILEGLSPASRRRVFDWFLL